MVNKFNVRLVIGIIGFASVPAVTAGVMEQLTVDPDTGVVIAVKDYEEPKLEVVPKQESAKADSTTDKAQRLEHVAKSLKPVTSEKNAFAVNRNQVNDHVSTAHTDVIRDSVVTASSVTTQRKQPMSDHKPAAQDSLSNTVWSYMRVSKPNKRVFVDSTDGQVYFQMREGSLKENISALINATGSYGVVMSGISDNHRVEAPMWLSGDTAIDVLDAMLVSYEMPYPIRAAAKANRIVEVYYDTKRRGLK